MPLSEYARQRLDGIVERMHAAGESDADIQFVVDDFKSKYGAAPPPAAATRGMIAPSGPNDMSEHDRNQAALEYGLAGALPEKTPGPLAAASVAMLAAPVIAANPEAIPAAAARVAPFVKPVAKAAIKHVAQGVGVGAGYGAASKIYKALLGDK